jgi:hypothetical protein
MKAITVEPKNAGTARFEDIPEPNVQEGSVLVEAVAVGVAVGVAGALALTGTLRNLLYEVEPTDLPTFATVAIVAMGIALLAARLRQCSELDRGIMDFVPPPVLIPELEELRFASPDSFPSTPPIEATDDSLVASSVP